jgi:glucose/arabinose dehydrogenase
LSHSLLCSRHFIPLNETRLGLAFDPLDQGPDPAVYFTAQKLFHRGNMSTSGMSINGRIMRASGPTLDTVETIISGLPVSDYDHGLNAIEFGDNGELYFSIGASTNGGIPGELSSSQKLQENFLSAGINVAYLSHPDFDGFIRWTSTDDGNMVAKGIEPYGMGLRNSYGMVLHSNGNLYATDNGPNEGYGKMSTGCGPADMIPDQERPDKLIHVQKGHYYGHPNRKRASYFNEPRQCVWRPVETMNASAINYTPPLLVMPSPQCGIVEFHSNHFQGQIRGNLIVSLYKSTPSLSRIIVLKKVANEEAQVVNQLFPLNVGVSGLDIAQTPNGNLVEMRFATNAIGVQIPNESNNDIMVIKTVFPHRGSNAGGNRLSIFGTNFGTNDGPPFVMIGNAICTNVAVISQSRIDCVNVPGGYGTVDITVWKGTTFSKFEAGYRYISGTLPLDFVLPVYPG